MYAFGRATGRRLRLAVQTNGTLLTAGACRRLAAIDCAVGVSLDGLPPANGCRVFPDGTPAFDAAAQGIRALGQAGLRCNLTTVVTRANARELERLKKRAAWGGCGLYCYAQTEQSLCVDRDGLCWPCSSLAGDPACCLGQLGDTLPALPRSQLALDAPESCRSCGSFDLCGGGCPAGRSASDPVRDRLTCVMHHVLLREAEGAQLLRPDP